MNSKVMRKISIAGKKKEDFFDIFRVKFETRKIMKMIRTSARNGNYSTRYSRNGIDSENFKKVISNIEKKGYKCSKIKRATSFGLYEGLDIEWR